MKRTPALVLAPADAAILRSFGRYHFLTAKQVTRLHYAARSLTHVQEKLKRLKDAGYLRTNFRYREGRSGSSPLLYSLTLKGRRALEALGVEVAFKPTPSEEAAYKALFFDHTMAVNDVLIAVELLTRRRADVALLELKSERELKRLGAQVQLATGEKVWVHLDSWFNLHFDGSPWPMGLELDRGTEGHRRWRQKIAALVGWRGEAYPELFGVRALTTLVVVTPKAGIDPAKREHELLRWTEETLLELQQPVLGQTFLFTSQPVREIAPEILFFAPVWHSPFAPAPVAALEVSGG